MISTTQSSPPRFSEEEVRRLARELYGVNASVRRLESYIDQNFHLTDESGRQFVFKIANSAESEPALDAQNQAMEYLAEHPRSITCPRVCRTLSGKQMTPVRGAGDGIHFVRMLTHLQGEFLATVRPHTPELLRRVGHFLGTLDTALEGFHHPGAQRDLRWDLKNAVRMNRHTHHIRDPRRRRLVEYFLLQFETFVSPVLPDLRASVIHNDANDDNLLVSGHDASAGQAVGIIDFGDLVYTHTVCELAIAIAYAVLGKEDPVGAASQIVRGYHQAHPLTELELEALFYLICARLCISVTISACEKILTPENTYITVTENAAWEMLQRLIAVSPDFAHDSFRRACGLPPSMTGKEMSREEILAARRRHIGKSLSVAYQRPLKIVRGAMQYVFDEEGRTYLDAANNVAQVGHCHPRVVRAAGRQMALLNTNTRYLHDALAQYAGRLCAVMPEPLGVCFFVCSGSEANDLALRLARAHTGGADVIVVEGAYHGTTNSVIELSPYKFDGPGGSGAAPHVQKVPMPDVYRGIYQADDPDAGKKYARYVQDAIERMEAEGKDVAAFFCESLIGCGGQIVLPDNYLKEAFQYVREAGGVCLADEVQVGFGRVGSHFWGFETQGVVPDIVTLGKPIGNGHPLAAVVTTPEIAESFNTGMEYFNTFGGTPVSCAIGLAVLDVIEEETLQENALRVGARLKKGLEQLMENYPLIGDVRGLGLFLGVELVLDRNTLEPAPRQAAYLIERMKERGVLISADGPLRNVLKIKPPLVLTEADADFLVGTLDEVLNEGGLGGGESPPSG